MEQNDIFLKVHNMEDNGVLQEIQIENDVQNQLLSQALMSSQEIKVDESSMQWGYVIDTDSKLDIKLQNYETKPATITVIKIGGIEDLNPLNFSSCVPSLNPLHQVVLQDNILVEQIQESPINIPRIKDRPKKSYVHQVPTTEPAVVCQNCDASFPTKYQYQRHQCEFNASRVTLKSELPKRNIEKPKTRYECDICHKSFMTDHNLDRHRLSHGDTKPYTCQNCGKGFVLESRLNTHIESHCRLSTKESKRFYRTDLTVWQCFNCKLITATEPQNLIHICDNLNPSFVSAKKSLPPENNPGENKENIDPLATSQSPSEQKTPNNFDNMYNTPKIIKILGERNSNVHVFNGQAVPSQNNFDKNFEKAIDGMDDNSANENAIFKNPTFDNKSFVTNIENIDHRFKRISVEQLFQCEFCNRTYADKNILKDHQNSHTTDKNYQCMFCEESFESYTNALVHWQHKCDDKSNLFCLPKIIICKFCDKGFKSHELLYAHKYKLKHFLPKVFNNPELSATINNNPNEVTNIAQSYNSHVEELNNNFKNNFELNQYNAINNGDVYNDSNSITYNVNNGFSTVTITEFVKENQEQPLRPLSINEPKNMYGCENSDIVHFEDSMDIENFDCDTKNFKDKINAFSEEEIHDHIMSTVHPDNCSHELMQIDEFLNDIANKVLNKSEPIQKFKETNPSITFENDEDKNESNSNRKHLKNSVKRNEKETMFNGKSDKKLVKDFEIKEKDVETRMRTRNMERMKNKNKGNESEQENKDGKKKKSKEDASTDKMDEKERTEFSDTEESDKKRNLKKKQDKNLNIKEEELIVEENKENVEDNNLKQLTAVTPVKRGRKPKPKMLANEVISSCEDGFRFQCEKCAKVTRSINELMEHRQADHGSKFGCKDCGQVVHSSKALMIHCRAHQSLKPFVCDQCGRSYSQTSHLWQHMRFHQGIKPFACPHEGCEARYTIRPDLKDHIRKVHTRERPFRCAVCGKCFLTGSVYYQHRLIHNNDRRYGCELCGKRFFRADALNNHRRIHTDERPFPCPVCGREFRQKGDRNKHHRTQHPNEMALNLSTSLPN